MHWLNLKLEKYQPAYYWRIEHSFEIVHSSLTCMFSGLFLLFLRKMVKIGCLNSLNTSFCYTPGRLYQCILSFCRLLQLGRWRRRRRIRQQRWGKTEYSPALHNDKMTPHFYALLQGCSQHKVVVVVVISSETRAKWYWVKHVTVIWAYLKHRGIKRSCCEGTKEENKHWGDDDQTLFSSVTVQIST